MRESLCHSIAPLVYLFIVPYYTRGENLKKKVFVRRESNNISEPLGICKFIACVLVVFYFNLTLNTLILFKLVHTGIHLTIDLTRHTFQKSNNRVEKLFKICSWAFDSLH